MNESEAGEQCTPIGIFVKRTTMIFIDMAGRPCFVIKLVTGVILIYIDFINSSYT